MLGLHWRPGSFGGMPRVVCTGMEAEEVLACSPGRISISAGFSAGSISVGFGLALAGFGWISLHYGLFHC